MPGVYLFLNQNNEILYIGKAKNLKKRVSSYFSNLNLLGPKTKLLLSKIRKIKTVVVPSEIEALLLEANYIKKYKPKYNVKLTYGNTYTFIRITVKDKYPKILIARKKEDKTSTYFGPFLNSQSPGIILKTIRRIFPFQSSLHHPNRPCLYYHLGLCPCPEIFKNEEYQKNIKRIISFLEGKTKKVIKDLKVERDRLSKLEEFEKAHRVQKKIDSIEFITNPTYQFDHKIDPNLPQDVLKKQLDSLEKCLLQNEVHVKKLERIECYDISNISGKHATGSMIVFSNGEKDPSQYRRFKIRYVENVPDDFAMMQEVLRRRIKHAEWPYPDLIIVDGGKGQVSSAMNALKEQKVKIPVIGLAKKQEIIITPDFTEITLPRDSEALKLVMLIRDEAHRFAVAYHRKIRSKHLTLN